MSIVVVFPAPFGTEERDDLAALDLQVDTTHRLHGTEVLVQPTQSQRRGRQ